MARTPSGTPTGFKLPPDMMKTDPNLRAPRGNAGAVLPAAPKLSGKRPPGPKSHLFGKVTELCPEQGLGYLRQDGESWRYCFRYSDFQELAAAAQVGMLVDFDVDKFARVTHLRPRGQAA